MNTRKGGPVRYSKDKETTCLTAEKVRHIYKKVESDSMANVNTIKQEIEDDKLTRDRNSLEEDKIDPYQNVVLNKVYKEDAKTAQMEQWSILSDVVKYIQHDKGPKTLHDLNVKALDYRNHKKLYDRLKGEERQILDIDFGNSQYTLKRKYVDMYKGGHAEVLHLAKFDECSALSTTYFGKTNMTRETKIKAEEKFPISGRDIQLENYSMIQNAKYC